MDINITPYLGNEIQRAKSISPKGVINEKQNKNSNIFKKIKIYR